MDYALCEALRHNMQGIPQSLVCYDIMCQFGIHFLERVQENPYLGFDPHLVILKGIGLFHIHGHQDSCFAEYAPNFILGAGMVDGEIIETLWSWINLIAGSTRGMSSSHRHEVLDDHMNSGNWKKLIRSGEQHVYVQDIQTVY